jgi:hypothetical protein
MQINNILKLKLAAITVFGMWLIFVGFLVIDANWLWESELDIIQTLEQSYFARGMFLDIGFLSTVIAGWIAFATKYWWRWFFAIGTIFLGGVFSLPYISFILWMKSVNLDQEKN